MKGLQNKGRVNRDRKSTSPPLGRETRTWGETRRKRLPQRRKDPRAAKGIANKAKKGPAVVFKEGRRTERSRNTPLGKKKISG